VYFVFFRSHNRCVRIWILVLLASLGCRKKRAVPVVEDTPPPVEAPAQEAPPPTVDEPPPPQPLPPPVGHAPTSAELRAKLEPLFPQIGYCMTQTGIVAEGPKYLLLRFTISNNGKVTKAEVDGHAPADSCVANLLSQQLRFEPWSGGPSQIALPITRDGKPVPESAFSDGGT
jgi:hypothetical protein